MGHFAPVVAVFECRPAQAVEGVELGDGAVDELGVTADKAHAAFGGVGDLAVADHNLAVGGAETVAAHVVDDAVLDAQFQAADVGGIADDAVGAAVDVAPVEAVAVAGGGEADALPLVGDAVVGLVFKHEVGAVAAQDDGALHGAFGAERAIDTQAGVAVEVEERAGGEGERGAFIDGEAVVNQIGPPGGEGGVGGDMEGAEHHDILAPGGEHHLLLHAVGEGEEELGLQLHGLVAVVDGGREFDEDAQAVALGAVDGLREAVVDVHAIDIDAEALAPAVEETDVGNADAVVVAVIDHEEGGGGADARYDGVEPQGVFGKGQAVARPGVEFLLVHARAEQQRGGENGQQYG